MGTTTCSRRSQRPAERTCGRTPSPPPSPSRRTPSSPSRRSAQSQGEMKSLRERMSKTLPSLSISTKKVEGAFGEREKRKVIQAMSESDFARHYRLGGQVMESTHVGMSVLFATRLSDGVQVVVKVRVKAVSFKKGSEEVEWRTTTELQMNMPKTDSICELLDVIETKDNYYVVMEKVEGKDLFEQMAEESIKHVDAREIIRQILEALSTMHGAGRIHKDLKLENVMVDMDSPKGGRRDVESPKRRSRASSSAGSPSPHSPVSAKLIDFDTVESWEPHSPKAKDVLGTDGYIAPEAYTGCYSPASDIYCVGVIMYKLLTKKFPSRKDIFDDKPGENYVGSAAMKRIYERLKVEKMDFGRSPLDICRPAAQLCEVMLCFDAEGRPSADEALAHEWFQLPADRLPERQRAERSAGAR